MAASRRLTSLGRKIIGAVASSVGDSPLVIALSGGADSAVLAWAGVDLGRQVRSVHVHHRWDASDRLAAAASSVADRLGIEHTQVDVNPSLGGSREAAARDARYTALEHARRRDEQIATAHTSTDQAETVVGNLMWGAGLDGLRGIHEDRGSLVRPLLSISRSETRELATLLGLPFTDDPANDDEAFRRVRIRRALAAWEHELAPRISQRLVEMSAAVGDDLDLLERRARQVPVEEDGDSVRIPLGPLRTSPPAVAVRAVRRALRSLSGGYPGSRHDVEAVLAVASGGPPTHITGGWRVDRSGVSLHIGERTSEGPGPLPWNLESPLRWGGWTWSADEFVGRPSMYAFSPYQQVFDRAVVPGRSEVSIRPVERGDELALAHGHKTASEAMAEARIAADERPGWPAMAVDDAVVWIPGVRRAAAGWVTPATERYLVVTATREERWTPVGY